MNQMVYDSFRTYGDVPDINANMINETSVEDEFPNDDAKFFYDKLISANKPIYEGATQSILSISVQLLAIRSNWHVPQKDDEVEVGQGNVPPIVHKKDDNGKIIIQPFGKTVIPASEVATAINYAIRKQFNTPIYNWSELDEDTYKKWFCFFKEKLSWDPCGALHTSGRKAHVDVALELSNNLQKDLFPDELFLRTHKRKSGAWVDTRSEDTYMLTLESDRPRLNEFVDFPDVD
ncbi:hypothetical protein P8452_57128 [Trifolium repens]|nr:hypothetical protein P8452_57128 [Trifolium repens]